MAADRFVVLGLASARSPWFSSVAQWATAGLVPVEFVKCVSAEELRARLASGRPFSAVLLDAGLPAVDRDLIESARRHECAVIVATDHRYPRDWDALGASVALHEGFDARDLVDALGATSAPVATADLAVDVPASSSAASSWRGQVAAVCGSGGTGVSTVAMALAQGLAADVRNAGHVALADLALHAEQAMLHDVRDVAPGIEDLVEAHRTSGVSRDDTRRSTFLVQGRGYHLLLGLRRARGWVGVRPRAFDAAFASLTQTFRLLVCDCDADFDGEDEVGSSDVQDRNHMSRTAVGEADAVFVVGHAGVKGVHATVRVVSDVLDAGVEASRIAIVANRAPRKPRARAEITKALHQLLDGRALATAAPVFLPDRNVEDALRDGTRLPAALAGPLAAAFTAIVDTGPAARRTATASVPVPVAAGSLGHWAAT